MEYTAVHCNPLHVVSVANVESNCTILIVFQVTVVAQLTKNGTLFSTILASCAAKVAWKAIKTVQLLNVLVFFANFTENKSREFTFA